MRSINREVAIKPIKGRLRRSPADIALAVTWALAPAKDEDDGLFRQGRPDLPLAHNRALLGYDGLSTNLVRSAPESCRGNHLYLDRGHHHGPDLASAVAHPPSSGNRQRSHRPKRGDTIAGGARHLTLRPALNQSIWHGAYHRMVHRRNYGRAAAASDL